MKQNLLFVMALLLLNACGSKVSKLVTFEMSKTETTVALADGNDAPSCKVLLEIAYAVSEQPERAQAINAAIVKRLFERQGMTVQQAAEAFANQYTTDYKRTLAPLYQEDRNDAAKHAWYEYHYEIRTETAAGRDDNTVVYLVHLDFYEGGAHGIQQLLAMNFDAETGQPLMLESVFVSGYEQPLSQKLLEKLMDIADVSTEKELTDKGYLYSMDMFPSQNFILGEDGITFIYNPYEIAPYAMGKTEITLSYGEIEELLKK